MLSKEQIICDFFDFLEYENPALIDEFLDKFVAKADKEEYIELYHNR